MTIRCSVKLALIDSIYSFVATHTIVTADIFS